MSRASRRSSPRQKRVIAAEYGTPGKGIADIQGASKAVKRAGVAGEVHLANAIRANLKNGIAYHDFRPGKYGNVDHLILWSNRGRVFARCVDAKNWKGGLYIGTFKWRFVGSIFPESFPNDHRGNILGTHAEVTELFRTLPIRMLPPLVVTTSETKQCRLIGYPFDHMSMGRFRSWASAAGRNEIPAFVAADVNKILQRKLS